MGKKSKQNKKARTKNGVIFSELSKYRKDLISAVQKKYGLSPFSSPDHEVWQEMFRFDQSSREERDPYVKKMMAFTDIGLVYKMGQKEWHSVYVESDAVCDFLENSKPKQSDGVLVAQAAIEIEKRCESGGLAIHLANRKHSIFVSSMDIGIGTVVMYSRDFDIGFTPIRQDGSWDSAHTENDADWSIIFNLFLYMDAFPASITVGAPPLITGSPNGITCQTVSASKPIEEMYKATKISPHMRRGHFRTLKNERFTKKRYQAVFVRPTMVRGSAETISD